MLTIFAVKSIGTFLDFLGIVVVSIYLSIEEYAGYAYFYSLTRISAVFIQWGQPTVLIRKAIEPKNWNFFYVCKKILTINGIILCVILSVYLILNRNTSLFISNAIALLAFLISLNNLHFSFGRAIGGEIKWLLKDNILRPLIFLVALPVVYKLEFLDSVSVIWISIITYIISCYFFSTDSKKITLKKHLRYNMLEFYSSGVWPTMFMLTNMFANYMIVVFSKNYLDNSELSSLYLGIQLASVLMLPQYALNVKASKKILILSNEKRLDNINIVLKNELKHFRIVSLLITVFLVFSSIFIFPYVFNSYDYLTEVVNILALSNIGIIYSGYSVIIHTMLGKEIKCIFINLLSFISAAIIFFILPCSPFYSTLSFIVVYTFLTSILNKRSAKGLCFS